MSEHDDAIKDCQTVNQHGESLVALPDGVTFWDVPTHLDSRGSVCEIFDPRWGWHEEPLVFVYAFTVRPGMVKGWGMHRKPEDRHFILAGELEVVLYDERPESSTNGQVSTVGLSEYRRRLMNIPAGVWHANRNIGAKDVIVINCPTMPYDHADPDKYRLPLDTDRIPYRFPAAHGW